MGSDDLKRMAEQVFFSKFRPPQLRNILDRPRLLEMASTLSEERLLLINAGPGYGKTTLMAQVAKYHSGSSVWYQMDKLDQDIAFFIKHLIVGVSQACSGIGDTAASKFAQAKDINRESKIILNTLMEELNEKLNAPLLLCFDDFHLMEKAEFPKWIIQHLVEKLPASCIVCISSRSFTNLPVGKLRTQGLIREIEARNLQFSLEELRELLSAKWKVPIDDSILAHLSKTTEGWAAGLVLAEDHLRAGKSLQEQDNGNKAKKNIYQYLAEEALERQSEKMRIVLEKCSLADPIDPSICESAMDCADVTSSLASAERMNLFTTRLDDTNLYRFHPMFRDFLYEKLLERLGDAGVRELRGNLGRAYEESNQKKMAIDQYLGSNQFQKAVDMIEEIGSQMLNDGEYLALERVLKVIPKNLYKIQILIYKGQLSLAMGRPQKALKVLQAIKDTLAPSEKQLLYEISTSIAECLGMLGKPGDAVKVIEPLIKIDYPPDQLIELFHRLGFYYWLSYDEKSLNNCINNAQKIVARKPSINQISKVEVMLAGEYMRSGEFSSARRILTEAIGIEDLSASFKNLYLNNLASCLTMIGCYREAKAKAENCLERITSQKEEKWLHVLYDTYGCILISLGKTDLGMSYIDKSINIVTELELGIAESCAAICHLGSFLRRNGDYLSALEYHEKCLDAAMSAGAHYDVAVSYCNLGADLLRVENFEAAESMFEEAHRTAKMYKFKYVLTQIEYQKAWAAHVRGDFRSELKFLGMALGRAERFQHNHFLIQEGRITLPLITSALSNKIQTNYLFEILEKIGEESLTVIATLIKDGDTEVKVKSAKLLLKLSSSTSMSLAQKLAKDNNEEVRAIARQALISMRCKIKDPLELLTERETQIIDLIATGVTNDFISKLLFISERTVKAHITNIFRKLGLRSRLEAALYYQEAIKK